MSGLGILLVEANADDEILTLRALQKNHMTTEVTVAGTNAFVRKPIRFGDFTAAVRTLGAFWLLLNEQPDAG